MIKFKDVLDKKVYELPEEFTGKGSVRGFKFKQVFKNNSWLVYKVNNLYYEWFERRVVGFNPMFPSELSEQYDYKEKYPVDEEFGFNAYTSRECPDFNTLT